MQPNNTNATNEEPMRNGWGFHTPAVPHWCPTTLWFHVNLFNSPDDFERGYCIAKSELTQSTET